MEISTPLNGRLAFEEEGENVNVQDLLDKLAQPLLGMEERLSIVGRLREVASNF